MGTSMVRVMVAAVLMIVATAHAAVAADVISAREAQSKAQAGEVVLVDIRTPQEWQETGVGAEAHAITMHQAPQAFWTQLAQATGGDKATPVALICRTGNRSAGMQAELLKAGYTRVLNVGEGMAGSGHGVGWLKAGLKTRPGQTAASQPPATGATQVK